MSAVIVSLYSASTQLSTMLILVETYLSHWYESIFLLSKSPGGGSFLILRVVIVFSLVAVCAEHQFGADGLKIAFDIMDVVDEFS